MPTLDEYQALISRVSNEHARLDGEIEAVQKQRKQNQAEVKQKYKVGSMKALDKLIAESEAEAKEVKAELDEKLGPILRGEEDGPAQPAEHDDAEDELGDDDEEII